MEKILFYLFSGIAVLGALGVITLKKPTRALLSLIVTMFALAVHYILLQAPFVAMVHLIVYAGAVLVLFLFVIMLLGIGALEASVFKLFKLRYVAAAFFVPAAFLVFMLSLGKSVGTAWLEPVEGSPASFGRLLFTQYLLPFELVSFLLLIGVFAAVSLALPEKRKES